MRYLTFILAVGLIVSCREKKATIKEAEGLRVDWQISSINLDNYRSQIRMVIKNITPEKYVGGDWTLYYNMMGGRVDVSSMPQGYQAERINGEYHKISSSEGRDINPYDSLIIEYTLIGIIQREAMGPVGMFLHIESADRQIPIPSKVHWQNAVGIEKINLPTAASRYYQYASQNILPIEQVGLVTPTPTSLKLSGGQGFKLSNNVSCNLPSSFSDLRGVIEVMFNKNELVQVSFGEERGIKIQLDKSLTTEAYQLNIRPDEILISAGDRNGVIYGLGSLAQIWYTAQRDGAVELPALSITDRPRFAYRGIHFDIGRNYFTPDKVKQLLDFMALFKLNKFHFNVTEDEGWRLEIPGLAELTEVGSRRGFTKDESDRLNPAYGSGPDVSYAMGTGYYTRAEFIDILRYADARGISVIPEINAPAHARAAIIAMKARYNKYMAAGDQARAEEYILHDPEDKSEYISAQQYNDNVICVCRPSAMAFVGKVVDEIVAMYREAGVPMEIFHAGGDEVPFGAWQKSPICQRFIKETASVNSSDDLHQYYLLNLLNILRKYNVRLGGWEEIVLKHGPDGHNTTEIDMTLVADGVIPYVWNATWGDGREDMVYKLANVGYDVVMCNSSAYYFDMTDDMDPENYGLSWSGYVNYKDMWSTEPTDIFQSSARALENDAISASAMARKTRLVPSARSRFLGIQGQMWTETIRSEAIFDEMMYPNLPIFAERAWAAASTWYNRADVSTKQQALEQEWNVMANTLGQRILPVLTQFFGGVESDLPKPGGIIRDGKLYANAMFPGTEIRYTLDGTIPDNASRVYTEPIDVAVDAPIALRCFDTKGRGGRVIYVKQNDMPM